MKKTEVVLLIILSIGLLFKFFHYPGGNILMILSLMILSIIYCYFSFAFFNNILLKKVLKKESYVGISALRIIGAIIVGVSISTTLVGILFKMMSWPGADVQLLVGAFSLTPILIIVLFKVARTKYNYYYAILKRLIPTLVAAYFLLMIPVDTWLNWKYPNNPEYVEAVLNLNKDPNNPELQQKHQDEWNKMMNALDGGRR